MPLPIEQESLAQRQETALLRSMEAALSRLGQVEQQAIRTAVESDLANDKVVAVRLTVRPFRAVEIRLGLNADTL